MPDLLKLAVIQSATGSGSEGSMLIRTRGELLEVIKGSVMCLLRTSAKYN